jgi:hypothetical protein
LPWSFQNFGSDCPGPIGGASGLEAFKTSVLIALDQLASSGLELFKTSVLIALDQSGEGGRLSMSR